MAYGICEGLHSDSKDLPTQLRSDTPGFPLDVECKSRGRLGCKPFSGRTQFGGEVEILEFDRANIPNRPASLAQTLFALMSQSLQAGLSRFGSSGNNF